MEEIEEQALDFAGLLGLERLPTCGAEAQRASARFAAAVAAAAAPPPPLLSQLLPQRGAGAPRPRFADVATGVRLRYLEWNPGGDGAVLLLHDAGEAAEVWAPVASLLADRGYRVVAPDLRGHGGSGRSAAGRYGVAALADDARALVVELDLYARPVAVVGAGAGGAAALRLAAAAPALVGAAAAVEFVVPRAAARAAREREGAAAPGGRSSAAEAMPGWGFWAGQAAAFGSAEEAAAFLAHPLAAAGPLTAAALRAALEAAAAAGGDPGAAAASALAPLRRPLAAAARAAAAMLRPPPGGFDALADPDAPALRWWCDPAFFCDFDVGDMLRDVAALRPHLLLLRGAASPWATAADAAAFAGLAAAAASVEVAELPGAGRRAAANAPEALARRLAAFLEGPAAAAFAARPGARAPEALRLRPLPEYASLEAARRALGPRAPPTAAAVEAALARLRADEGADEGAGEGAAGADGGRGVEGGGQRTALALDPPDYFGFVG